MVSTVRFLDAVKTTVETQDVHAFIEIGPHPALQGPTRQILGVLGVAAEKPVLPSLARDSNELLRMLTTVGNLYTMGVELNWTNLLSATPGQPNVLRGLPSFPWQHQKYWHESEISIRNRFRESAHELLGHRLPHPHGAWENELSLANVPYLRDHVVQGNVVFPAAGYCALAIAVAGTEAPVLMEEMTFKRPIMFEPPEAPVKTQVTLNKDSSLGAEHTGFTIYLQDNKQWVEISTGSLINRAGNAASHAKDIAEIQQRCTVTIPKEEIYNLFVEAGLEYGPFFQGIQQLARGDKEAVGEVTPSPSCAQSAAYLLHPTLLDACFQCLLGAVSNLSGSYLPTSIKSLEVVAPCHEASYWVHAVAREINDRVLVGDITIYSKSGSLLARVEALQCNSIGKKASAAQDTVSWAESAYVTAWKPDISQLNAKNIRSFVSICPTPLDREADHIASMHLQRAVKKIQADGLKVDDKHKKLYDWTVGYLAGKADLPTVTPSEGNIESAITERVGSRLFDIFTGAADSLSVVFEDSLLHTIYEKGDTFKAANGVVKQVVALLKHKNTGLRVLEIGAGTGGTTSHVLPVFGKHFESYTYTDISPSFFEAAKTKFAPWVDKMKFSVLNIEKDPATQNYPLESYDLILATDVLHATKNMVDTLRHVKQLLAPGGSLVLNELTSPGVWVQMVFGTLSGWWLFEDPEIRALGPTITGPVWEKLLLEVGFDTVLGVPDREEAIHTVFTASRNPLPSPKHSWDIISTGSPVSKVVAGQLGEQSKVVSLDEEFGKNVVYLAEYEQSTFFHGVDEKTLATLKKITKNAEHVLWVVKGGLKDCPVPEQAPLAGFVRSVLNEYPSIKSITVDVGADATPEQVATAIATATTQFGLETEIAFRDGVAHVPRLMSKEVEPPKTTLGEQLLAEIPVRLEVGTPGLLSTLRWREVKHTTPLADNEVEIAVRATGLNFKDIMLSMGMLGDEAVVGGYCTNNLGIECSGIITAIGSKVANEYKIGDRVVAVAKNCFSSRVRTISSLAVRLPDHITFEEAATIPATFLTASYALNYLARLSEGERVLIHAAAGGVGLAAIQLCKLAGAEVFATVGSDTKRKFIRDEMGVPDDHIMSSRTLDFVHQIMEKTNGKGVDIVLNSLAGEALKKSVTVLAPFGRFLEIGKRDIYANSKLDMINFGQNVSFFGIDLDRLNGQKPHLGGKLFRELIDMFAKRLLKPLPITVYSYANVEQAFRFMQQGKHIGKVVLSLDTAVKAEVVPSDLLFRHDRSYILVGGLGGFGCAVARWMAKKGAGHLVFLSRSGASSPEAKELLSELQQSGCAVSVPKGDVADEKFVASAVAEAKLKAPIAGVIQAAMVLEDVLIDGMTVEALNKVLVPKVKGTYTLHKATLAEPLDFFISFSSVSSVVGNLSQSNYAAANAYLDALAHWRIANGLPATSINWGAIGDVGYVATRKDLQQNMAKRGIKTLPIEEALAALVHAVEHPFSPQFVAAPMIWSVASKTLSALNLSKFGLLLREDQGEQGHSASKSGGSGSQVTQKLAAANTPEEKTAVILEAIREKLASMLNVSQDSVEPDNQMSDLGVDSLMAVEMKNWISAELKATNISVLDLTGGRTIANIAEKISKDLSVSVAATASNQAQSGSLMLKLSSPEKPSVRMICFPYLGGDAMSFKEWPTLYPDAEIWAYNPTSKIKQWDELLQALTTEPSITSSELPLVLYGHSLGGLIAYELAMALEASNKQVQRLIVGACGSPRFPNDLVKLGSEWSDSLIEAMPSDQFITLMIAGGLISNTNDPEMVRASILLGRRYTNWFNGKQGSRIIGAPLDAIVADNDIIIGDTTRVKDWKEFTSSAFTMQSLKDAHHLFITQDTAIYRQAISTAANFV